MTPLGLQVLVDLPEPIPLDLLPEKKIAVTRIGNPYLPKHLANDHLDVLVVDLHTLKPVDLLHFVYEVGGQGLLPLDLQDIVGIRGSIHQGFTGPDPIVLMNTDVLALGNQVFVGISIPLERGHEYPPLAANVLTERNHPVDLGHHRTFFRLSGLEEFRNAGQTTGNILGLTGLARNLRHHATRSDFFTFGHGQERIHGQ